MEITHLDSCSRKMMERFRLRQWESRIHFANRGAIPIGGYGPKEVALLLFLARTNYLSKKKESGVDRQNNKQSGIEERKSRVFVFVVVFVFGYFVELIT